MLEKQCRKNPELGIRNQIYIPASQLFIHSTIHQIFTVSLHGGKNCIGFWRAWLQIGETGYLLFIFVNMCGLTVPRL